MRFSSLRFFIRSFPCFWEHANNSLDVRQSFESTVDFFTQFWSGIDDSIDFTYYGQITQTSGGSVTPAGFFSRANEPRMFTVTPDQHHAIHSVSIRNIETNTLIPYQESAMDLQTGAKSYMFTMPHANIRIAVSFHSLELSIPVIVKYASPDSGKLYTASFALLYDSPREESDEISEGESQNDL